MQYLKSKSGKPPVSICGLVGDSPIWRGIFWNEILSLQYYSLLVVKRAQPGMGPDEQKTRRSSSASKSWVASDQGEPPHFASY